MLKRIITVAVALFLLAHYIVVVYYSINIRAEFDKVMVEYEKSPDGLVFADIRIDDVQHPFMGADLKLFHRLFVDMGGTVDRPTFNTGRKRHRAGNHDTGTFGGFEDLIDRLIQNPVFISLQPDADTLRFRRSHTYFFSTILS